jgi:hypothetical protein
MPLNLWARAPVQFTGRCRIRLKPAVNSGDTGDICHGVLVLRAQSRLNGSSYGDGKPSRRFGLQFATVPICSGTRSGSGWETDPWRRCPEIAR